MTALQSNFEVYRRHIAATANEQGIEALGIYNRDDFERVMYDERTIVTHIQEGEITTPVPLLTPADNLPRVNQALYARYGATNPWVHCHSPMSGIDSENTDRLTLTVTQGATVLIEHASPETTRINAELAGIHTATGYSGRELELPDAFQHFQYIDRLVLTPQPQATGSNEDLLSAYQKGLDSGYFTPGSSVSAPAVLSDADVDQVWEFYEPAFDELSDVDPILAGSDKEELRMLMQSPEFIKAVYRREGRIVNISIYADVRDCEWMNQAYYRQHFPNEYDAGLAICSAGVVTDRSVTTGIYVLQTLKMIAELSKVAGVEPVLSFACDHISNNTNRIPYLAHTAVNRVPGASIDFRNPQALQHFRAVQFG